MPAVAPCAQDGVGVFVAAQAAVEARQSADDVAFFDIVVVAQDGAAVAQVGADVEQVVRRFADIVFPKRHDLHQPPRAHAADGVLAERAFDFDQTQNHLGIQLRAAAFVLDVDQQAAAFGGIGNVAGKAGGHRRQPAFAFVWIGEHEARRIDIVDGAAHH